MAVATEGMAAATDIALALTPLRRHHRNRTTRALSCHQTAHRLYQCNLRLIPPTRPLTKHPLPARRSPVCTTTEAQSPMEPDPNMHKRTPPRQHPDKTPIFAALLAGLALWAGLGGALHAQDPSSYQIVGSVAAYLGIMPAQIVGTHPPIHPETQMHGGPPNDAHSDHIVVALFENPSGTRIEDAKVEATISGLGETAITPITLEAMPIAGVVTYGGYVRFSGRDTYTIALRISRPGSPIITKISFEYDHSTP